MYVNKCILIKKEYLFLMMSVKGCITDFHIDFGGSSSWYHILNGKQIFLLVKPTKDHLSAYEIWYKNEEKVILLYTKLILYLNLIYVFIV